jgi:hypothetical protein
MTFAKPSNSPAEPQIQPEPGASLPNVYPMPGTDGRPATWAGRLTRKSRGITVEPVPAAGAKHRSDFHRRKRIGAYIGIHDTPLHTQPRIHRISLHDAR